jgi:transcriptional regulator GlxA family with amidase domain
MMRFAAAGVKRQNCKNPRYLCQSYSEMIRVSLIAIPEAGASLLGAMELLNTVGVVWREVIENKLSEQLFDVRIVSESGAEMPCSPHWIVRPHSALGDVNQTDVVFIPPLWVTPSETFAGRHEVTKQWIVRQYNQGAMICAACTGAVLLADTGLLDDEAATTHWAYESGMRRNYPRIDFHVDKVLVESGVDGRLITSGSHATWYDALLYLISRTCGREAAVQTAKFLLLQWHTDGQSPYRAFQDNVSHGDAAIRESQAWLRANFSHPTPVESVEKQSGLAPRSFKRRFKAATGLTVIGYVQQLRVEHAKSLLESADTNVDDISWRIGYEDVGFFRRLFKRLTGLTPRDYRRKFQLPRAGRFRRGNPAASLGRAGAKIPD